jgi:hypothetical protein
MRRLVHRDGAFGSEQNDKGEGDHDLPTIAHIGAIDQKTGDLATVGA